MAAKHGYRIPRRGFCLCCLSSTGAAVSGVPLTQRQAFAQARNVVDGMRAEAANAPTTGHKLRGNISALVGSGGNTAVLTAPDGKVLVDAGMNASRPRITETLGSLGGKPVTHLINTHWHFDHADGNEWLREQGALILALENTRKHLVEATRVEDGDFSFPPSPAAALPAETVAANRTLKLDGNTLELKQHGRAHTDGGLSVHFSEADVLHGGDVYWKSYPFIDCSTGGKHRRHDPGYRGDAGGRDERDLDRPGHGGLASDRSELEGYRGMLVAVREKVAALGSVAKIAAGREWPRRTVGQAAIWNSSATKPACARMSRPPMFRTCPFLTIAIAS